jgi:hypothetical protein
MHYKLKAIRSVFRLTSRGDSNFSSIQAQNVQVKFLVIFNSGKSLIFVVLLIMEKKNLVSR